GQLCPPLLGHGPTAVTPIRYAEVLTLPCLDSQARSPDCSAHIESTFRTGMQLQPFDSDMDHNLNLISTRTL
ncbi:hypothetical protein GOODEAATRI_032510, partial [Goodea atripinnis]